MAFYAIALDGGGEPCKVLTSNPGHLLFTRLVAPQRARKVGQQLLSRDFAPGWGVRHRWRSARPASTR